MVEWTGYRVALELASPVHIGWRTVGNLKQTRRYLPGMPIWGALAARLARDTMGGDYAGAGKFVADQLRFTYFYPSDDSSRVRLWPWRESSSEFEWLYLNSYVSTALRDGRANASGMLHEVEYIAPNTRSGGPVFLVGYCWSASMQQSRLESLWGSAQFGGERTYGFGRIRKATLERLAADARIFDTYTWVPTPANVVLSAGKGGVLLAHMQDPEDSVTGTFLRTAAEPLVGRRIRPEGKYVVSTAEPAWAPGAVVRNAAKWEVAGFGIWHAA